jgi:nicotinate-nucleotide pyrophosphorylase (carboxylating)
MKIPAWLTSSAVVDLVRLALEEDAVQRDITSLATVPADATATGTIVVRQDARIAGLPLLTPQSALMSAFPTLAAEFSVEDGATVGPGTVVAAVKGSARHLLGAERTLLNFLQRLSGIATETARYVAACAGTKARIMETRKTCPGFRILDK